VVFQSKLREDKQHSMNLSMTTVAWKCVCEIWQLVKYQIC